MTKAEIILVFYVSIHKADLLPDLLPHDLVTSPSREIRVQTFSIAVKFYRHFGSNDAKMPTVTPDLAGRRLHDILR